MAFQYDIPFGNNKGTPLDKADEKDIRYWLQRKQQKLQEEPDHQYAAKDRYWCEAAEDELVRRRGRAASPSNGSRPQRTAAPRGPAPLTRESLIRAVLAGSAGVHPSINTPGEIAANALLIADAVLERLKVEAQQNGEVEDKPSW